MILDISQTMSVHPLCWPARHLRRRITMQANCNYKERTRAELTGNKSLLLGPGAVKSRHIEMWQTLSDSSVGCVGSRPSKINTAILLTTIQSTLYNDPHICIDVLWILKRIDQ